MSCTGTLRFGAVCPNVNCGATTYVWLLLSVKNDVCTRNEVAPGTRTTAAAPLAVHGKTLARSALVSGLEILR